MTIEQLIAKYGVEENTEELLASVEVAAERTDADYTVVVQRLQNPALVRLLHVAMGLATETGEFVDQLKKHIFYGKPLDKTNLAEELGDLTWYMRIAFATLDTGMLEILLRNVEKLRVRYPDKFTEQNALERDLTAEAKTLSDPKDWQNENNCA